jgi:co-chaperonin GroES (HSP10)
MSMTNRRVPRCLALSLALSCAVLLGAASAWAQNAPAAPAAAPLDRALGVVTKLDATARTLSVKTDTGAEIGVTLDPKARFQRVAPGETDLKNAAAIQLTDISVGDRVIARGKPGDNQTVAANLVVVMSQADVAKKQAADRADWDKRGIAGLVTAVGPDSVTINARTLSGARNVVLTVTPTTIVRRYAPDSIKFDDATNAKLTEIQVGDQVRARGNKNDDGSKVATEEIVAGTFKTTAGLVQSVDAQTGEIRITDIEAKKPLVVKVTADSTLHKLQPNQAQLIALRVHPEYAALAANGGGRGQGKAAGAEGKDAKAAPADGNGRGGGRGAGADLQQIIDRSPAVAVADLKTGDAIVVTSTLGANAGRVTAITLVAGVEPILTKPGTREMSLGSWSLEVGGGGEQ